MSPDPQNAFELREAIEAHAAELCRQFGIRRLSLFGSVARNEATDDSDIDFLAEFQSPDPETMPERYFGFIEAASRLFQRPVQLLTPRMLRNPHLIKSVSADLHVIHEYEQSLKWYYDALVAARAILQFVDGRSFEDYCADDLLSSAIERKFEIIGEALNRIKRAHPEDLRHIQEWPAIIGFRNLLAHGCDHVEDSVVWGIVSRQIPEFIKDLEAIEGIEGP